MAKVNMPSKKDAEPDLREKSDRMSLAKAYNWYNYFFDSAKAKEYALAYLKSISFDKEKINRIKKIPEKMFINSVGWNSRILTLGGKLPDGYSDRMYENIERMINDIVADTPKEEANAAAPKISIQERTEEKINSYIASIETELDKHINDPEYEFNMYEWLKKNEVKPQLARGIADYYIPQFNELIDVLGEGDKDIKEGYTKYPKKRLVKLFKFVEGIVNDSETHAKNVKKAKERKPRTAKAKTTDQIVSKIKYKSSDDKYKITSIRPVDIVGADQLLIFNAKTRFLGIYKSDRPTGLSMKGTTIVGYNTDNSTSKKLRKPDEQIKVFAQDTKAKVGKFYTSIKSKEKKLNGRINSDTILLRVFK
jgi:hypothetical protein